MSGRQGETIMMQAYPQSQPNKIDEAAENWVATLREIVVACRSLRSGMGISPAEKESGVMPEIRLLRLLQLFYSSKNCSSLAKNLNNFFYFCFCQFWIISKIKTLLMN